MEDRMVTAEEAVWNALLEMEPQLSQMEEPDVPLLTAKFLDELQVRGFAVVAMADLEAAGSVNAKYKYMTKPRFE